MKQKLAEQVVAKALKIAAEATPKNRALMDSEVQVLDVSFTALAHSVKGLTPEEYAAIYAALKSGAAHFNTSLPYSLRKTKEHGDSGYSNGFSLVDDLNYGQFLVGKTYAKVRSALTNAFKSLTKKHANLEPLVGVNDSTGRTESRLGHIASGFLNASTPMQRTLRQVAATLPTEQAKFVHQLEQDLISAHTFHEDLGITAEYAFDRTNLSEHPRPLDKLLGKGTILLTIQTNERNTALSGIESRISTKLRAYLESPALMEALVNEPGSNTIIEDLTLYFRSAILGKQPKAPTHNKKPPTKRTSSVRQTSKVKVKKPNVGFTRNAKGQFTSLAALHLILKMRLHDQIQKNMGTGASKNVLNYRTGRFASTAEVSRLAVSREGMITAFYTYMKNPYATFSEGGLQQYPRSRDPKLLIAKSIREIAATQVVNRLRAVNV